MRHPEAFSGHGWVRRMGGGGTRDRGRPRGGRGRCVGRLAVGTRSPTGPRRPPAARGHWGGRRRGHQATHCAAWGLVAPAELEPREAAGDALALRPGGGGRSPAGGEAQRGGGREARLRRRGGVGSAARGGRARRGASALRQGWERPRPAAPRARRRAAGAHDTTAADARHNLPSIRALPRRRWSPARRRHGLPATIGRRARASARAANVPPRRRRASRWTGRWGRHTRGRARRGRTAPPRRLSWRNGRVHRRLWRTRSNQRARRPIACSAIGSWAHARL